VLKMGGALRGHVSSDHHRSATVVSHRRRTRGSLLSDFPNYSREGFYSHPAAMAALPGAPLGRLPVYSTPPTKTSRGAGWCLRRVFLLNIGSHCNLLQRGSVKFPAGDCNLIAQYLAEFGPAAARTAIRGQKSKSSSPSQAACRSDFCLDPSLNNLLIEPTRPARSISVV
jgi:hypothetical protein